MLIYLAGAFFITYEGTKSLLNSLNRSRESDSQYLPTPVIHALASPTAELVSCLILTPAEVLKQNAQMVTKSTSTQAFDTKATVQAFRQFKKPSQLFRGYTALAGRNLPFTAMQFPLFEYLKNRILDHRSSRNIPRGGLLERGLITAIAAGSAGTLAAVLTTPIDVVKTRIMLNAASEKGRKSPSFKPNPEQVQSHSKSTNEQFRHAARSGRAGPITVDREISRSEGLRALFRGGALRGSWTALGSGLYLGVYEIGRSYLEARRAPNDS